MTERRKAKAVDERVGTALPCPHFSKDDAESLNEYFQRFLVLSIPSQGVGDELLLFKIFMFMNMH